MIWRAEDHTNTAKALALSQFILNEAGQKMDPGSKLILLPIALASCCDLAGPAVKKPFSGLHRAGSFFFPQNGIFTVIYCVCKRVFVRTAESEWQLCPECSKVSQGKKNTGSVSHLLFLLMYMHVCACMCAARLQLYSAFSLYKFMRLLVIVRLCVCMCML